MDNTIAVIGSGAGGLLTATLLAEAGFPVILFEKGGMYDQSRAKPYGVEEIQKSYAYGGITASIGRPPVNFVEGSAVGGGTEVNSGLYYRLPKPVFENWQKAYGYQKLDFAALEACAEANEAEIGITHLPHAPTQLAQKLIDGCTALNWSHTEVPRLFDYADSSTQDQVAGTRNSLSVKLLPRFLEAGGRLLANTSVKRLQPERTGWQIKTTCRQHFSVWSVFLGLGSIATPGLLKRSKIPGNWGRSCYLHPSVRVVADFGAPVNTADSGVGTTQVNQFAPDFTLGCSASGLHHLAAALCADTDSLQQLLQQWQHAGLYYASTSAGTGRIMTVGAQDLLNYRLTTDDMTLVNKALHHLIALLFAAGADRVYPCISHKTWITRERWQHVRPSVKLSDDGLMSIHVFGSCPMGSYQQICAADEEGSVYNQHGLYLCDASLLGNKLGVNSQGTVMSFARYVAQSFIEKYG